MRDNCFPAFGFVSVLFKHIQDACVVGMVSFILWLMTLAEGSLRGRCSPFSSALVGWGEHCDVPCPWTIFVVKITLKQWFLEVASQMFGNVFITVL